MKQLPDEQPAWEGRAAADWQRQWALPQLHFLNVTGSTNDDARALAEQGAPSGTTVIAEFQTAGRGRRGRAWQGTAGLSLHFSMLVRAPRGGFSCLSAAPVRVGLLCLRALQELNVAAVRLKWPNDLQLDGRKLGGILCESVLGAAPFLVIGIGINVGQTEQDFPDELRSHATSLALKAGQVIPRSEVAGALARQLLREAGRMAAPLDQDELARLLAHDALRGHAIAIDDEPLGTALGINEEGALLVHTGYGVQLVRSGTVRVLDAVS